jgi:multiple sugar transport system substrate-binding protein
MKKIFKNQIALALAGILAVTSAIAGTLVINGDTSDPAPKAAFQAVIDGFEAENPDVNVVYNLFDHEGYKAAIRNFLTADAPDIAFWYAGNRMAPYVDAGLFAPIDDVWAEQGLYTLMKSSAAGMTMDGKKWGIPFSYYQVGMYYRQDIFEDLGIAVPKTWDQFMSASATLKANDITPITIGTKYLWTTGCIFDYLNLRTNGYDFHMDLANGNVAWTDDRVRATMAKYKELVDKEYFDENHASYTWQEALGPLASGEGAMVCMGNFAVAPLRELGLDDSQLGFFQFPEITPGIPMAEEAPSDTLHLTANAKNPTDAKRFLAYAARADVQTSWNAALGQLPTNSGAEVADDKFIKAGFEQLNNASALSQYFDRDIPAEMAALGMESLQEFMVKPERLEKILERLEKARQKLY